MATINELQYNIFKTMPWAFLGKRYGGKLSSITDEQLERLNTTLGVYYGLMADCDTYERCMQLRGDLNASVDRVRVSVSPWTNIERMTFIDAMESFNNFYSPIASHLE